MAQTEGGAAAERAEHERLRLFIAVLLPEEVRATLGEARAGLERDLARRSDPPKLRWVRPEAMHLTLRFLGETPATRVPAIEAAMAAVGADVAPHTVTLASLGTFGGRRPRVIWAGLDGAVGELRAGAARLDCELTGAGFSPERREFRPHLTLARVPDRTGRAPRQAITEAVAADPALPPSPLPVDELHLIHSRLTPGGAQYTTLATAKLRGRR